MRSLTLALGPMLSVCHCLTQTRTYLDWTLHCCGGFAVGMQSLCAHQLSPSPFCHDLTQASLPTSGAHVSTLSLPV